MLLAELRTELLNQHKELRDAAIDVAAAAHDARAEPRRLPELRTLLMQMAARVMEHNSFEDRELHAVLKDIDAWGALRDRLVDERHAAEHASILAAVKAAAMETSAAAIADAALRALADLAAHMEHEERELLAADVLRDDLITSGVGG